MNMSKEELSGLSQEELMDIITASFSSDDDGDEDDGGPVPVSDLQGYYVQFFPPACLSVGSCVLCPKDYFDETGYLSDWELLEVEALLSPHGNYELSEGAYELPGTIDAARTVMVNLLGAEEKKMA